VYVNTFGTAKEGLTDAAITSAVEEVFSFKPADIVSQLKLLRPIYSKTTNYGHFGKDGLPWESTDKAAALAKAAK
jgi:S-adenosylmethionine synthetase